VAMALQRNRLANGRHAKQEFANALDRLLTEHLR